MENKAWYVRREGESVKIYDHLDSFGNGNIRFAGTVDDALFQLARKMGVADDLLRRCDELTVENDRLKSQAKGA